MVGKENNGGYRQPMNPAPVSGPGALSQRTDGGAVEGMTQPAQSYTGGSYGNNKEMADQQGGAPLAGSPMPPMPPIVGLDMPTQFPDEPLSAGANYGEGPGLDTSGIQGQREPNIRDAVYRAMKFDTSGELEAIYNRLNQ
jgi:hypothetical protein